MTAPGVVRRAYQDLGGLQLHYRTAGKQDLPVLLLLHQSPSSSAMYHSLMATLSGRYHMFAVDTPGFGHSDALPGNVAEVQIADYARCIGEFCSVMGFGPCFAFGHHTGAAIAVQLAYDYPEAVRAMALSGPTLLSEEQKRTLPALASPFSPTGDGTHLLGMWQRLRDKDPQAPLALTQRELLSAFGCGESYQASYEAVTRQDFAGQLRAIECPVLVYAGDQDPLYDAVAPSLELLQRGASASLPGGERTYVCERQADAVAAIIDEFFSAEEN